MASSDPNTCRRALREIGEIAAVAVLQDSQMTDQEALENIAAIAEWADDETPRDRAECGPVIHALHSMTGAVDFETLDDRSAVALFDRVIATLAATGGAASVLADRAGERR